MQRLLLKLLVVDDKPAEREGIINITDWNSIGITIAGEAENGLDGIEKAKMLKPDIIITDIVMPHVDGFKMVEEIKKTIPDIKVIFISCFDNFNFAKSAINVNAMGYVLKPIIAGELLSTVSKVTGIHIKEIERKKEEEDLIRHLRENLPVIRDQFIKDILFGLLKNEEEIWDKNDFLEAGLSSSSYHVLAAECDSLENGSEKLSEEKKQLKHLEIKEWIDKICKTYHSNIGYYITSVDRSRLAILIIQYGDKPFDIGSFAENLKKELTDQFKLEFTIGISGTVNCITAVHSCYQEACDALKFKFYLGKNQIIDYSEIYQDRNTKKHHLINSESVQNELKYLIMTGEQDEIDQFTEKLFENETVDINIHYIQYTCISIVSYLQISLSELNESLRSIFHDEFGIFEEILKLDTLIDIKHWLKDFIWSVSSFLSSKNSSKYKKVIDIIKDYLHNHYTEDLSVSEIAEKVYLSPCYTNYIFRKETGKTLIEYLTKIRIEEAKKLLQNSLLKVYEIAEKVGYKSNSYFCSVFKEHCGMTPLEYRDRR